MQKLKKSLPFVTLYLALGIVFSGACPASTPAGTEIPLYAECRYSDLTADELSTARSNTVTLRVRQVFSVECAADAYSRSVPPDHSAVFRLTVTNTGNGPDSFTIDAVCGDGWQVGVFQDADFDGTVDPGELRSPVNTPAIAAGSSYTFAIALVPSDGSADGDSSIAVLWATSAGSAAASDVLVLGVEVETAARVRDWSLIGCFADEDPARLSVDYLGGEADAAPGRGAAGMDWYAHSSPTDTIDLGALYAGPENCVCYAGAYVCSAFARRANLVFNATDASQVWFNGVTVYDEPAPPPDQPDRVVPVDLFAGWNRLVFKLGHTTGPWTFSAGFADADGWPLTDVLSTPYRQDWRLIPSVDLRVTDIGTRSATLRWETEQPTSTTVDYWCSQGDVLRYHDPALTTRHVAPLADLLPDESYGCLAGGCDVFGYEAVGDFETFNTPLPQPGHGWIAQWLINGPHFPSSGVLSLSWDALSGETAIYPYQGMVSRLRTWQAAAADAAGVLDFHTCYPGSTMCLGYAHVYVYSSMNQNALLFTSATQPAAVLVNGEVISRYTAHPDLADDDVSSIVLRRGWNRVLIKTMQWQGDWRMRARLTDPAGAPLRGVVLMPDIYD